MEINNKWTEHFSVAMDPTHLSNPIQLVETRLESGITDIMLMVVEDDPELLRRWGGEEYRLGLVTLGLPKAGLGLWAVGIYQGTDVMLEWDVAVVSRRGEIYKLLEKLQHQRFFHVCVLDVSGRSRELIEFKNRYREPDHLGLSFIHDVAVNSSNVEPLMKNVYDSIQPEVVHEALRAAAFGSETANLK